MKRIFLIILPALFSCTGILAQMNNQGLENRLCPNDSSGELLGFSLYSNSFFKNNEFFDSIAQGYTLFGTQLAGQLYYIPHPNLALYGGIYLRKDFGHAPFTRISPLFTVKWQKNGHAILFGNLEGNVAHRLCEPLYNYERLILDHLENGLQYHVTKSNFWSDTWLNWEVQQYLRSPYQEELSGGHSSRTQLWHRGGWSVTLPLQGLIYHKGGQLDTDTTSLKTLLNTATGLIVQWRSVDSGQFIQSVCSENYVAAFNELSPAKVLPYRNGNGVFINLAIMSKYHLGLSAGYWSGNQFLAIHGGDLYQSRASVYGLAGYTEDKRRLGFLRAFYQHKLAGDLYADIRFEPFYDFNNALLEYSYSAYLTYRKNLTLINLTKRKASR